MINKWIVTEPEGRRKGCIIALPGRGVSAEMMDKFVSHMGMPNTLRICLEPYNLCWYPQPNGADDQKQAVIGMHAATAALTKRINRIQRTFRLRRQQIALVGYSAGSVMALNILATSKQPFTAVAVLAGAILEPHNLPIAVNETPILLRHAIDDDCFSWEERYLPMKEALSKNDYNLYISEKSYGGHGVSAEDARVMGRFVAQHLGYKEREWER